MIRRNKIAVTAVVCALNAILLGGCSSRPNSSIIIDDTATATVVSQDTVLTFFGYKTDASNLIAIENALHSFMDKNENSNITYEGIESENYWRAFDLRVDADAMDDILMVNHDRLAGLTAKGKLADLSDLSGIDAFGKLAQNQFTEEDGSVYFVPLDISTYGLYINYDLLEEHGQKIPSDLAEFTQVCDYFTELGIVPIVANNHSSLKSLIVAKGLYPVYQMENPARQIEKFNSGEADLAETLRPGIELLSMMIECGWFNLQEVSATTDTDGDLAIFSKGERPFMITAGWASPRVRSMNPELNYGVHPFPVLEDGSVLVMDVGTCISINAGTEHMAEAKEFVEHMIQPDVNWEYCDSQSCYTALTSDKTPADETIVPSLEYLTNGRSVIGSDYKLDLPLDAALTETSEQMLHGMNSGEAVQLLKELLKT